MQVDFGLLESLGRLICIDNIKDYASGYTLQVVAPKLSMIDVATYIPKHKTVHFPYEKFSIEPLTRH